MQNSGLFESVALLQMQTDKTYYNLQFPTRQTVRIHSSQKRRTSSTQFKSTVTPYKGPPPRSSAQNNNFFQPIILTQQRNLRKSEPFIFEGAIKQVNFHPKKKGETISNYMSSSNQNRRPVEIKVAAPANVEKPHSIRIPIRATQTDKSPIRSGFDSERSWKSVVTRDTLRAKTERRRGTEYNETVANEDRYSNIKLVKNDRSKSQCDIQYHLTSADIIIAATDNRYFVIEEVMRGYSLDFIPENSTYIICQNPLTQNYSVVFTEKTIPTCKECHVPIRLELSYNHGFRILCKSGYCSKEILYNSRLNNYTVQNLWSHSPQNFPGILHTEKQEVSKMIQNGTFRHRDITKSVSDYKSGSQNRPKTSLSPNPSQPKEVQYSLPTSIYQSKAMRTRQSVDWRKHTESMRDTKEYFGLRNCYTRVKSRNRLDSFSVSRNNSVRDCKVEEKESMSRGEMDDSNMRILEK